MQHAALLGDFAHEGIARVEPPPELLRRAHQQIQGKWRADFCFDRRGLIRCTLHVRHDDEQIHVRIGRRPAACMGTEKDNSFRPKAPRDFVGVSLNLPQCDH